MGMVTEMHLRPAGESTGRFNYRGKHRYLITLLCRPSSGPIAKKEHVEGTLRLLHSCSRSHLFELYAYCFLPDRLVLLIRGMDDTSDMKAFLSDFRASSSAAFRGAHGTELWMRKYQERVLRKTELTRAAAEEIFHLPVKAGLASTPGAYPFQGSHVLPSLSRVPHPSRARKTTRYGKGRPPFRAR
ncbi:MAG TPA: hypothetical protein VEO56_07735 [Bacteroidota bacterium]|nr:hypothetical protein [Bacteroidota bacterium]